MSRERSRLGGAGLAILLLAGGFATLAGPAEAGRGFGFSGGFQGGGVVVRSPAHHGFARSMPAPRPTPAPGTMRSDLSMQSGFVNQRFVPAITPGFLNEGFIPPIAPGFLNEGFIPAISPGFMNEGFIPPIAPGFLNEGFVPPIAPGFPNQGFISISPFVGPEIVIVVDHRFGFHRFAFNHRFAFDHRFAFNHRFGSHRHFFVPFAGFGFGDAFFGAPAPAPEIVEPEDFGEASPPGPSVEPLQEEQPFAAHDVRVGSGHRAEASAGSRKDSGTVVVMRPGFQDEVVTVPRDAGGG